MNWILFTDLFELVLFNYWMLFVWSYFIAILLYNIKYYARKNIDILYWPIVKFVRFLAPVRKQMWIVLVIDGVITDKYTEIAWLIMVILYAVYAWTYIDKFGDDDRKKKPSKVKSFVKALGHRLVIVPGH